jgi:hypothetical protein
MFIDIAQFGFILLAIIFFIVGMHPAWSQRLVLTRKGQTREQKPLLLNLQFLFLKNSDYSPSRSEWR